MYLDSWCKYDSLVLDLPRLKWCILINWYSHGVFHQNPTFGPIYGHETGSWTIGPYPCSEVCTLITYETIPCYQELNYLKFHPGITSIQSPRSFQKKKKEEEEGNGMFFSLHPKRGSRSKYVKGESCWRMNWRHLGKCHQGPRLSPYTIGASVEKSVTNSPHDAAPIPMAHICLVLTWTRSLGNPFFSHPHGFSLLQVERYNWLKERIRSPRRETGDSRGLCWGRGTILSTWFRNQVLQGFWERKSTLEW